MSAQTKSLSLVFISAQDIPESVVATLSDQGICVDPCSDAQWCARNSSQTVPDVIVIQPLPSCINRFSALTAQLDMKDCLVIVVGAKDRIELDSQFSGNVYCWPSEFQAAIEQLKIRCTARHQLLRDQTLREEFISLKLIGSSPQFLTMLKSLKKVSHYDAPVLIKGETGTGKEMAARAIHYLSIRRDNPFIPVDCGAIPDNLIENEMFGHERGAYTDARQAQHGLVAQAEGGTLFLDEIDALSAKAQVTLLRFIQSQEYRPLGSQRSSTANIRIIAATNANLPARVAEDRFRQDLLFRIDVLSLELPPLRQRNGDVENLTRYFLEKFRRQYDLPERQLSLEILAWMRQHQWPGNVRELENFIHREFLLGDESIIPRDLPLRQPANDRRVLHDRRLDVSLDISFHEAKERLVEQFEKKYLRLLMRESSGNVTKAARISGKERRALGKLLKKHGIDKDEFNA